MKDPYQVLGVARSAAADEIKQAYRALARELHPDLNPGDRKSEERFKEISAAYDFLSDADRRARYDRGDIDATGAAKARNWRSHGAGPKGGGGGRSQRGGFGFGNDADEILEELLRRRDRARSGYSGPPQRGQDARHGLGVTFVEAAVGVTKRVTLVTGKALDVRIPAGSVDGQALRLKGQGHPGSQGGEDGDAFVDIAVEPHPFFVRRDLDVLLDLPVSVQEAMLGGKVTVPTVDGKVSLTVPAGSNTGSVLRLKGKGVAGKDGRGDQLVTLKVMLPDDDADLKKFVDKWGPKHGYDPRAKAGM
ncbi:MAG: J domain-containing protein [Magnetospirillum sp.]|nr:J domain-containing protein [Magnetospirillum sp.]